MEEVIQEVNTAFDRLGKRVEEAITASYASHHSQDLAPSAKRPRTHSPSPDPIKRTNNELAVEKKGLEQTKKIDRVERRIGRRNKTIERRDEELKRKEGELSEKCDELQRRDEELKRKGEELAKVCMQQDEERKTIKQKDEELKHMQAKLDGKDAELEAMSRRLRVRNNMIREMEEDLDTWIKDRVKMQEGYARCLELCGK